MAAENEESTIRGEFTPEVVEKLECEGFELWQRMEEDMRPLVTFNAEDFAIVFK